MAGTLSITVHDGADSVIPARFYVQYDEVPLNTTADYRIELHGGHQYLLAQGSAYTWIQLTGQSSYHPYFYSDGQVIINNLPAGDYTLIIGKGFNYGTVRENIAIPADGTVVRNYVLQKLTYLGDWHAVEEHCHRETDPVIWTAEDLSIGIKPACGFPYVNMFATNVSDNPDSGHLLVEPPAIEGLGAGFIYSKAAISLMLNGQPFPSKYNMNEILGPFLYKAVHEQGGQFVPYMSVLGWGGNSDWTTYVPLGSALGYIHAYGALENLFNNWELNSEEPGYFMDRLSEIFEGSWYRLLNTGLKLTATAGSDNTASGAGYPLGSHRVYAKMQGGVDFDRYESALIEGQTFVTNRPLLFVTVNGQDPGTEFHFSSGATQILNVRTRIVSDIAVSSYQIIENGEVIQNTIIDPPSKNVDVTDAVSLNSSSWIAVRCFGNTGENVPDPRHIFAHSSPFYILFDNRSVFLQADADHFKQICLDQKSSHASAITDPDVRQALADMYDQAIDYFSNQAKPDTTAPAPPRNLHYVPH